MGYHIILELECILKDEFIKNFHLLKDYFYNLEEDKDENNIIEIYNNIPENLKIYADIWKSLNIFHRFYWCDLKKNILKIKISKKPYTHEGLLEEDYITFIKNIIVPISSLIINCEISHDDHDFKSTFLTDDELRNN